MTDNDFSNWLNKIDAFIGYEERRDLGPVEQWRDLFTDGLTTTEAVDRLISAWNCADDRYSGGPGSLIDETYDYGDHNE